MVHKLLITIRVRGLTHFRLNKLSPHYILEESNFNFKYVRLCEADIPREKWLNYLQTGDPDPVASDLGLHYLQITLLRAQNKMV